MDGNSLLHRAGTALYGPRWQTALARDLGVTSRTVRYWVAGEKEMPPRVWAELVALLRTRRVAIDDAILALAHLEYDNEGVNYE